VANDDNAARFTSGEPERVPQARCAIKGTAESARDRAAGGVVDKDGV
jgi:hypothetical protein